jgi:hypothetical protein
VFQKIEIVDKSRDVPLIIGIQDSVNGTDQPELVMKDEGGREVPGLLVTPSGGKSSSVLIAPKQKVALGFLSGSDVSGHPEEGSSWGMRIRGQNGEADISNGLETLTFLSGANRTSDLRRQMVPLIRCSSHCEKI